MHTLPEVVPREQSVRSRFRALAEDNQEDVPDGGERDQEMQAENNEATAE